MMKIFKIALITLMFCITLASCSKAVSENDKSSSKMTESSISIETSIENITDYNKLFELNIYSDKTTYKTTDKIKLWATLKYIGLGSQIKIWHGDPYISFIITDGKGFKTGGVFVDILTYTTLDKGKLYKFDYVKSGGYSADDPNAAFLEKFYKQKDLYLPKGEYTVKVGGAFSLLKDTEKSRSNLGKEILIKVIE